MLHPGWFVPMIFREKNHWGGNSSDWLTLKPSREDNVLEMKLSIEGEIRRLNFLIYEARTRGDLWDG